VFDGEDEVLLIPVDAEEVLLGVVVVPKLDELIGLTAVVEFIGPKRLGLTSVELVVLLLTDGVVKPKSEPLVGVADAPELPKPDELNPNALVGLLAPVELVNPKSPPDLTLAEVLAVSKKFDLGGS
jgi:hypothetical protein